MWTNIYTVDENLPYSLPYLALTQKYFFALRVLLWLMFVEKYNKKYVLTPHSNLDICMLIRLPNKLRSYSESVS